MVYFVGLAVADPRITERPRTSLRQLGSHHDDSITTVLFLATTHSFLITISLAWIEHHIAAFLLITSTLRHRGSYQETPLFSSKLVQTDICSTYTAATTIQHQDGLDMQWRHKLGVDREYVEEWTYH